MGLEKKEFFKKELSACETLMERFSYLIKKASSYNKLTEKQHLDKFKVKGCNSQLWLVPELRDEKLYFLVDSDAAIPKGIAVILAEVYSGLSCKEILSLEPTLFADLEIQQHLSMSRRNGLSQLYKQVYLYAQAFLVMNVN